MLSLRTRAEINAEGYHSCIQPSHRILTHEGQKAAGLLKGAVHNGRHAQSLSVKVSLVSNSNSLPPQAAAQSVGMQYK